MNQKSPSRAGILIVDDHPIVRQGIGLLINQEPDLAVWGEAGSAEDALTLLDRGGDSANLAIVDLSLGATLGLDLLKTLRARFPHCPVLIMSMHDESLYAERALRAGARGYIMKQEATENILAAIRHILAGGIHLSERVQARILENMADGRARPGSSPLELLSAREIEVLRLVGRGYTTGEIARDMNRSVKTIEAHRANIKEKLHLKNSAELVRFAIQWMEKEG